MITEEQAMAIAKEAGCLTIPKSNGIEVMPPNFTRALNLAAAEALAKAAHEHGVEAGHSIWLEELAQQYREAAKGA